MKKRFFLVSFIITFVGLLIFAFVSTNVYYNNAIESTKSTLKIYMNQYSEEYSWSSEGAYELSLKLGGDRVTFLNIDGKVVGDSQKEDLGNHRDREEVESAINSGEGYSIRDSKSIGKKMVYYCKKVSDNKLVRISTPTSSIFSIFYDSIPSILIFILIDVVGCAVISLLAVDLILKPVEKIAKDGALSKVVSTNYEELTPLCEIINRRNKEVEEKIEKIKQNKRLENIMLNNMEHGMVILSKEGRVVLINNVAKELLKIEDDIINLDSDIKDMLNDSVDNILYKTIGNKDYAIRVSNTSDASVILLTDVTKIKNAERSKNDFLANVTHEMNTPLTSIKGFAELIKLKMVDGDSLNHACDVIVKQSNRLSELIKNIINYSSFESDDIELYDLNISDIIKNTSESLEGGLKDKNLSIFYDIDNNIVVKSRKERIIELTTNLVSNAIKYNKVGGFIKVSLKNDGNDVIFSVSDNGLGISEEEKDKIFDRFYTIDKSHNKETAGFGLGLAIVKKICDNQKWKIELDSTYNEGSTFKIIMKK